MAAAGSKHQQSSSVPIQIDDFGITRDGHAIHLYTLRNTNGARIAITNYGGIVVSITVPDRNGKFDDVVLGFDNGEGYLQDQPYFGALIGRFANRIANARFTLNGVKYKLAANNNGNSLHGGVKGFDKVVWLANDSSTANNPALQLSYLSEDGEDGYPGNLAVTVCYTLTCENELRIDYAATTDQPTVLNLTNHSYFNLAGAGNGDILSHQVEINAEKFTPINGNLIPTGEYVEVGGTPFDFRKSTAIGERINTDHEQLKLAGGYDHNFVLNSDGDALKRAARVTEPRSGRTLDVITSQAGMQLYTGNFLKGNLLGKNGKIYGRRSALCLETQHFPDSPNQPNFPSTVLNPGQRFESTTIYKFSTDAQ